MDCICGIDQIKEPILSSVVTIGNFDGVHVGHRELIQMGLDFAKKNHCETVVFTFDPHPSLVLTPEKDHRRIFSLEDQKEQLEGLGVHYLILQPFSRDFSRLMPEEFLTRYIVQPLRPKALVVGYDFAFGTDRKGTYEVLQELCAKYKISLFRVEPRKIENRIVSSSIIREAISQGDMEGVSELLGRNFYLKGVVERGDGRGQKIGFPTANLKCAAELLPKQGVYACWAVIRGTRYKSVTNIGFTPTFTNKKILKIETHLLEFNHDIYGEELRIEPIARIRNEKQFSSVAELVVQIQDDVKVARGKFD